MKYGKYEIKIKYNGDWPCLCGGRLIVIIDGKEWDFGNHVLISGGSIHFDDWYNNLTDIQLYYWKKRMNGEIC